MSELTPKCNYCKSRNCSKRKKTVQVNTMEKVNAGIELSSFIVKTAVVVAELYRTGYIPPITNEGIKEEINAVNNCIKLFSGN